MRYSIYLVVFYINPLYDDHTVDLYVETQIGKLVERSEIKVKYQHGRENIIFRNRKGQ